VRFVRITIALTAVVLVVAGCGGKDAPSEAESSPPASSPRSTPTNSAASPDTCSALLAADEVEELIGGSADDPVATKIGDLPACQWSAAEGEATVTAGRFPAADWARALPDLIGLVQKAGLDLSAADRRKLTRGQELVDRGGANDDKAACELFSTMVVRLQGSPRGSTRIVNYVPSREQPQAVNGQACEKGTYYTVQLVKQGLEQTDEQNATIVKALVHLIG
jgi:hypothetical protein